MEKNKIIITKYESSRNSYTYTITYYGRDINEKTFKEVLGWTRVLGPAEDHYAICLESDYTEGAVSGRTIGLLGIAHSKEELPNRTYQLVKDYATSYAEKMEKHGNDTKVVDETDLLNVIRLGGPCGDLASKL